MVKKLGTYKGTESGQAPRFADDPIMVSRTGTFSSFTADNDTSYNISRASNSGSISTWDEHHVLIHSIKITNTHNGTTTPAIVYFYQDNDTTNANALNGTNLQFWIATAGADSDRSSHTIQVDFPIPLVVRKGCVVTANRGGPVVNINYTVLNTSTTSDYSEILRYKYLTGASLNSDTATALHPNFGADTDHDYEIWGGLALNHSTANNDWKSTWVTSTGESNATKAMISTHEQKDSDDDASAAFTGTYRPIFYPYPVICKSGAKIDNTTGGAAGVYAAWFYRLRKSEAVETIGWI